MSRATDLVGTIEEAKTSKLFKKVYKRLKLLGDGMKKDGKHQVMLANTELAKKVGQEKFVPFFLEDLTDEQIKILATELNVEKWIK